MSLENGHLSKQKIIKDFEERKQKFPTKISDPFGITKVFTPSVTSTYSPEAFLDEYKKIKQDKHKKEIIELKKVLSSYRAIDFYKLPSKPSGINIPEVILDEDLYLYAKEIPEYIELIDSIENKSYNIKHIQASILSAHAYLYNAKTFTRISGENPLEFYERCMHGIGKTISYLETLAKVKNISIYNIVNEEL